MELAAVLGDNLIAFLLRSCYRKTRERDTAFPDPLNGCTAESLKAGVQPCHESLHEIRKVLQAGAPGLQLINRGENLEAGGLVAAGVGFGGAGQLINEGQVLVAPDDG